MVCSLSAFLPAYGSVDLTTKWQLDYLDGTAKLVDTKTHKVLTRIPSKKVVNIRENPKKAQFVLGDLEYTYQQQQIVLTFEIPLETKKILYQDDTSLQLIEILYRYCCLANSCYCLKPIVEKQTPYKLTEDPIKFSNITPTPDMTQVSFTVERSYVRPLCKSVFIHKSEYSQPLDHPTIRFTHNDELRKSYLVHHYTAAYMGETFFEKRIVLKSASPAAYLLLTTTPWMGNLSLLYTSQTRVAFNLIEKWERPDGTSVELSKSMTSNLLREFSYKHNDDGLFSERTEKHYIRYGSKKTLVSEPDKISRIPYKEYHQPHAAEYVFRSCQEACHLDDTMQYERPDGSLYCKKPISTEKEDFQFELL